MRRILVIASLAAALSGCASIVEGTTQSLAIATSPPGADCVGTRQGERLFAVRSGDQVIVSKSRHPIVIRCTSGQLAGDTVVESRVTTMGAAGVALDFGLTDYATGALNAYPAAVTIPLK